MSYKSLLFCPDERSARLVTQVLSDLEFAVELADDVSTAMTKLTDEHFDALVVDCQNEENAALLFKAARNSAHNHSSLSVAVVEGQAGVAKAFRIGANLVLTKPINLEHSKGTLRVARGLLRKNEPRPAASIPAPAKSSSDSFATASQAVRERSPLSQISAPIITQAIEPAAVAPRVVASTATSVVPSSLFEVEQTRMPAPEAAEAALLESMPRLPLESKSSPAILVTAANPIAAGTSGSAAAAAAPALQKPEPGIPIRPSGLPPMVTNEPIAPVTIAAEPARRSPVEAPTFSALHVTTSGSGAGAKFLKAAAILVVLVAAGYFGWQKVQSFHRSKPAQAVAAAVVEPQPSPVAITSPPPVPAVETTHPLEPSSAEKNLVAAQPSGKAEDDEQSANIEVQELPLSRDAKPAAKPLVVKADTASAKPVPPPQQAAAPALDLSAVNHSEGGLAALDAPSAVPIPTLAASTLPVSQGVSQGLILKKVSPMYPLLARQLRKEGTVELLATISKKGDITGVKVLSGDAMLAKAAQEAVRQWKYRPYLLNGVPVEIQTQVTINFKAPR
jgi:TonB family protein